MSDVLHSTNIQFAAAVDSHSSYVAEVAFHTVAAVDDAHRMDTVAAVVDAHRTDAAVAAVDAHRVAIGDQVKPSAAWPLERD